MSKTQIPTGGIADDAISEEHIDATVITGTTALAATPSSTDELLISDGGTLKRIDYTHIPTHVKLSSGSASSAANHDFQSFMDTSKYNTYMIQFSKVIGLAGNTFDFQFLDGSSVSSSDYWGAVNGYRSGDTAYNDAYEAQSQGKLGTALAASASDVGAYLFWIYNNPNSTTFGSSVYGHNWGFRSDFSDVIFSDYHISFNNNADTDGFRVHASGNDNTTFDYAIYGIAK
tara:strand:+ start:328 stop:1017 length:690 start_codon:yes stop_codon:yes gene_type:complete